ncbi:MAG TPA: hypothetical protein VIH21_00340 [Dehalococcoidia bacterium]|jgi:hypothetical protein
MRRWAALAVAISVMIAGCRGVGGGDSKPTSTATLSAPSPTATVVVARPSPDDASGEIAIQVDAFLLALQNGDRDEIQTLTEEGIPSPELDRIATCVPSGARLTIDSRNIRVDGGSAEASLMVTLTPQDGTPHSQPMELRFVRAGEAWRVSQLPSCPLDAG